MNQPPPSRLPRFALGLAIGGPLPAARVAMDIYFGSADTDSVITAIVLGVVMGVAAMVVAIIARRVLEQAGDVRQYTWTAVALFIANLTFCSYVLMYLFLYTPRR